mmetsp:Transcript_4455/g.7425  ORF Transcript_4455/g.7425 Transcript_4455/m.7425 type:complete len:299 (+) Transcript_4455:20-916(+)
MYQLTRRPAASAMRLQANRTIPRSACLPVKMSRRKTVRTLAQQEFSQLQGVTVFSAGNAVPVELTTLLKPGTLTVIPFLTHFADLSSWEYAQKLVRVLPTLEASGVNVIAIGLGSADNAASFARYLKFPANKLFADPSGAAYTALGFSQGFMPEAEVSPYLKLLPMLAGIGSPGTLEEVVRGYVGDNESKPVFEGPTPFDILGTGYQRPFELATLRLFNMQAVLTNWAELSPPNEALLTQQGGTLAFNGEETIFRYNDSGILKYTDVDALLRTVLSADYTPSKTGGNGMVVQAESTPL